MTGRPSSYSEEMADYICDEIINGNSLRTICAAEGMPDRVTVMRWLHKHESFATKYARAREAQADYMDDLILDVANASTSETASADRVKIGAYQWRASKLQPKRFGDRVAMEHTGRNGGPIEYANLTEEEINARLAALIASAGEASSGEEEGVPGATGSEGEEEV